MVDQEDHFETGADLTKRNECTAQICPRLGEEPVHRIALDYQVGESARCGRNQRRRLVRLAVVDDIPRSDVGGSKRRDEVTPLEFYTNEARSNYWRIALELRGSAAPHRARAINRWLA